MGVSTTIGIQDDYIDEIVHADARQNELKAAQKEARKAEAATEARTAVPQEKSAEHSRDFDTSVMNHAYTGKGSIIDSMT